MPAENDGLTFRALDEGAPLEEVAPAALFDVRVRREPAAAVALGPCKGSIGRRADPLRSENVEATVGVEVTDECRLV